MHQPTNIKTEIGEIIRSSRGLCASTCKGTCTLVRTLQPLFAHIRRGARHGMPTRNEVHIFLRHLLRTRQVVDGCDPKMFDSLAGLAERILAEEIA